MSGIEAASAPKRPVLSALLILLAVTTLARLALAGLLDLGQDEAYALAVSRSFQWSFFDHPPLAFWLAGLMQAIAGRDVSPFLLRLPFVLMFTGSTWAMFALTRRFYGERAGLWAAGLLNTAPFFFASAGSWVVPDGPLTLFLLLSALFLARALAEPSFDQNRWSDWLSAGLFLGLALLSKYQAVLTLVGAFALLLSRPHRSWLAKPQPYISVALALLLFLPVIWWNADHDWVSFRFQLGRGGGTGEASIGFGRLPGLLLGEAIYLLPWTMIGLVAAIGIRRGPGDRFLLALALPAILLFNLVPLIGSAGLPHWSMAGWLFLFPLLGRWLAEARDAGRRWPAVFGWASGLAMAALALAGIGLMSDHRIYAGQSRDRPCAGRGDGMERRPDWPRSQGPHRPAQYVLRRPDLARRRPHRRSTAARNTANRVRRRPPWVRLRRQSQWPSGSGCDLRLCA